MLPFRALPGLTLKAEYFIVTLNLIISYCAAFFMWLPWSLEPHVKFAESKSRIGVLVAKKTGSKSFCSTMWRWSQKQRKWDPKFGEARNQNKYPYNERAWGQPSRVTWIPVRWGERRGQSHMTPSGHRSTYRAGGHTDWWPESTVGCQDSWGTKTNTLKPWVWLPQQRPDGGRELYSEQMPIATARW